MKNVCLVFVILGFCTCCNTSLKIKQINNAPLYKFGNHNLGTARFAEKNITDSLRIMFKVSVIFTDKTHKQVLSVNMDKFIVQFFDFDSITGKRAINKDKDIIITNDSDITFKKWKYKYGKYIRKWYSKLDYTSMYNISEYPDTIAFWGVFKLIPEM